MSIRITIRREEICMNSKAIVKFPASSAMNGRLGYQALHSEPLLSPNFGKQWEKNISLNIETNALV